jgi:hypothetical protein
MRFLLKAAFWLTVVVMLLPGDEKRPTAQVGAGEAVSAATAAVSDMRQFCTRQPDACAVGSQAATTFGQKAQTGAKMLYDFLSERTGANETGSVSSKPADRPASGHTGPSQHTLTPADLTPTWRAPDQRKDAKRPA